MRSSISWLLLACGCTGSALTAPRQASEVTAIGDVHVDAEADTWPDIDTSVIEGGECGEALRVVAVHAWPGGGVVLDVILRGPDGSPASATDATLDGEAAVVAPAALEPGVTAFVLDGDVAAARELIGALPEGERVVVWNGPELIVDATLDRDFARARIAASTTTKPPNALEWRAIVDALTSLGGSGETAPKALVADTVPTALVPFPVYQLDEPELATRLLNERIGRARIGACLASGERKNVDVVVGDVTCGVLLPAPIDPTLPCDAAAAARGDWRYGDRVDLVLTPAEAAIWEARKAASSEEDFRGALKIGPVDAQPARLHFRGQTSLDCARKSYNVNLDGSTPRALAPGAAGDELYLISMCKDEGYYNQLLGDRLAARIGVFPLRWRLVTLYVNDMNQGLYLLMEDPIEALKDDHVALSEVVRRRLDQDGNPPEVEYAAGDMAAALARYQELTTLAADPEALARHLDVDAYLRWMALQMLLENGDYIDEVFFHTSAESAPRYRVMGWDPDDLWSPCHRNGRDAIPDPNGILYCVEGDIDHVLFANPVFYDRLVVHLADLLDALPIETIVIEMAIVRDQLFAALHDDATAAAMVELTTKTPSASTVAGFQAAVTTLMDTDLARAEQWMRTLRERITNYQEAPP